MEEARAMAREVLKREPKFSAKRFVKTLDYKDPAERARPRLHAQGGAARVRG